MKKQNRFASSFINTIIGVALLTGPQVFAQDQRGAEKKYTASDAAVDNGISGAEGLAVRYLARMAADKMLRETPAWMDDEWHYPAFGTPYDPDFLKGAPYFGKSLLYRANVDTLFSRTSVPQPLTDADIEHIISSIERSKTAKIGMGQLGGANLQIQFDAERVERALAARNYNSSLELIPAEKMTKLDQTLAGSAAKIREGGLVQDVRHGPIPAPQASLNKAMLTVTETQPVSLKWKSYNLHQLDIAQIRAQLKAIQESGAVVADLKLEHLSARVLPSVATGALDTLSIASLLYGLERLGVAAYHAISREGDELLCRPENPCTQPGFVKRLLDSSAQPSYGTQQAAVGASLAK